MNTECSLTIYHPSLAEGVRTPYDLEVLDTGCSFAEGPIWHPEGYYLFSDIPKNGVYRVAPGSAKERYLEGSGFSGGREDDLSEQKGSNGLALDKDCRLLLCQHGNHALAVWDGKSLDPLVSGYNGKAFNSPNDLAVHPGGDIFFSDPPYGLKEQQLRPESYQPVAGVYRLRNGKVELFCDRFRYPNGLCLSPDAGSIYITSNKPDERFVLEYDAETLEFRRTVAAENGDGLKCDHHGNLYLCSKEGVVILSSNGERIGLLQLPAVAANMCWGGPEGRDLFLTARENIFLIRDFLKW